MRWDSGSASMGGFFGFFGFFTPILPLIAVRTFEAASERGLVPNVLSPIPAPSCGSAGRSLLLLRGRASITDVAGTRGLLPSLAEDPARGVTFPSP